MIIVLNFICGPCGEANHGKCVNLVWREEMGMYERIKSQCDCQHRETK